MLISVCVGSVRGNVIHHLIESILRQQYSNWELIIAAQGNDHVLLTEVHKWAQRDPRISFTHLQQFGRSRALNAAMKLAHGDIFAFTDDDCEASPDWLATIAKCFAQRPDVGIVAGNLIPAQAKPLQLSTCPATYTIECIYNPVELGFVGPPGFYWAGANIAVRRSVVDHVGPFDEYLGVGTSFPSAEDVDFGLRAEALGVVMWTTPNSIIYHTYGRRYGLKNVLKHHRGYAMGRGALGAKLALWNHRLSKVWGQPKKPSEIARDIVRNPKKSFLDLYTSKYDQIAYQSYLHEYEIDQNLLSRPKAGHLVN